MYNNSKYDMINPALREALDLLEEAQNHFNNANYDTLDAAIYDLTAAEFHLRATLRRAREGIPVLSNGESDEQAFRTIAYPMPQLKQLRNNHNAKVDAHAVDASPTEE
ncbi:hypothetical protein SAMN05660649_01229 [Desulfotomaculum arcticum]|uniref:Uncharacterized protein n=1 Tax=Desulfotruncus arcticus DSM 17038 TaxID=1121424 RepID=A0A1I2QFW6_9FIRM|nr:hypothetical protein [Desulfotruncus arcticus]SFG27465.1 hypothetical protein SAMN05660649_01229 [Desulfotomaculum arcticum] [Desulfotruncus arcticus DSM 17038]